MSGPDLAGAQAAVEALMDDLCQVDRNPAGYRDATLDPVTLALLDPDPASSVYLGPCLLSAPTPRAHLQPRGQADVTTMTHWLTLPLSLLAATPAAEPQIGDTVRMLASRRDPAVVGQQFLILGVARKTFAVSRKCELQLRTAS